MIAQSRRLKIVTGWIKDSPEFKSLCKHKKALQELLTSCCFKVLSEDERFYYDTYGPKYVYRQLPFCVDEYLSHKEKGFQRENRCRSSMWVSPSKYATVFAGIPELYDVDRIELDPACPILANFTDSEGIKGVPKEIDAEIYEATRLYYNDVEKLDRKIKALVEVVYSEEASLREIKKVYPKLYDYSL